MSSAEIINQIGMDHLISTSRCLYNMVFSNYDEEERDIIISDIRRMADEYFKNERAM